MIRCLIVSLLVAAFLFGCSGGAPDETIKIDPQLPTPPVEGQLKVALLTPANVNDSGWSGIAYKGLQNIEKELGAKVNQEVVKDASIKDSMRSYSQDGYNLVIGHGFEYNAPALEVAKDFPDTVFITSGGADTAKNVGVIRFYLEEGFYLAGMIAGKMSKSGVVGMIGGPDVPSIRSTFKAFAAGAKSVRDDIVVIEKFTGSNDDVAAAQQATLQAIDEGADMLIHQTNSGVTGFMKACTDREVWAFGANEDQNSLSPQVLASAVVLAEKPFVNLAKEVKEGHFTGGVKLIGMHEGGVGFVFNPVNAGKIDPEVKKMVTVMQEEMVFGKFKTPKDEF